MDTISIQQALALMSEAGDKPFKIGYVRSTGKSAGSVKEVFCYYGAPNPRDRQAPTRSQRTANGFTRKDRATHLESNTVPLTEAGNRQLLTLRISHIISFQGKKVIH